MTASTVNKLEDSVISANDSYSSSSHGNSSLGDIPTVVDKVVVDRILKTKVCWLKFV